MKNPRYDEPLSKAAADSLRQAAKLARKRAQETKVPLVIWKDGKVTQVRVSSASKKRR